MLLALNIFVSVWSIGVRVCELWETTWVPRQNCRAGQGLGLTVLLYDPGLPGGQVQPQCSTVKLYFGFEDRASFSSSSGWENNAALPYDPWCCLMFILHASFFTLYTLLSFLACLLPLSPLLAAKERVWVVANNNNHKLKNPCAHLLCRS